jgi:hypothetical protein
MEVFDTIGFLRMPTSGTTLTSVFRRDLYDHRLVLLGFVNEFLFQVVEGPGDRDIAVFEFDPLCDMANPSQVF